MMADWAKQAGAAVEIYSDIPPIQLGCDWDNSVRAASSMKFTDWAKRHSTIVWTHAPHVEQVRWCGKEGLRTVVFSPWETLRADDKTALKAADRVAAATRQQAEFYSSRWEVQRVVWAPPSPNLPFTRHNPRRRDAPVRLLLPLCDRALYKTEATVLDVVGRLLARRDDVLVTVVYDAAHMAPRAQRRLVGFQRRFPWRLWLRLSTPLRSRPRLFMNHELTLWPAHYDSVNLIPLASIYMGTPVVAFQLPTSLGVLHRANSVTVRGPVSYNGLGMPSVDPDYQQLEQSLHELVDDRPRLARLHKSVLHGVDSRRNLFNSAMRQLVG